MDFFVMIMETLRSEFHAKIQLTYIYIYRRKIQNLTKKTVPVKTKA